MSKRVVLGLQKSNEFETTGPTRVLGSSPLKTLALLGFIFLLALIPFSIAQSDHCKINGLNVKHKCVKLDKSDNTANGEFKKSKGGCVTEWGWTGSEWVKKPVYFKASKAVVPGFYCTAINPVSGKLEPKPFGAGTIKTYDVIPGNWVIEARKNYYNSLRGISSE